MCRKMTNSPGELTRKKSKSSKTSLSRSSKHSTHSTSSIRKNSNSKRSLAGKKKTRVDQQAEDTDSAGFPHPIPKIIVIKYINCNIWNIVPVCNVCMA